MPRTRTAAILASLVLTATASGQRMLTVGPGGQFATIQGAVDAASPGDRVLVAGGSLTLNAPVRVGKGVTILGMGPATNPTIVTSSLGCFLFEGVPAGEQAVLAGIRMTSFVFSSSPFPFPFPTFVTVRNNQGMVCLHSCQFAYIGTLIGAEVVYWTQPPIHVEAASLAMSGGGTAGAGAPALLANGATVMASGAGFSSSRATASQGSGSRILSGPDDAVRIQNGTLVFDLCNATGGSADLQGFTGTAALDVLAATAFLAGESRFEGGSLPAIGSWLYPHAGGPGLRVGNGGSVSMDRCTLVGGLGVLGAPNGPPFVGPAPLTVPLPALRGPQDPVPLAGMLSYALRGEPGATAWFLLSVETGLAPIAGIAGVFALAGQSPPAVFGPVAVDAQGNAQLDLQLPQDPRMSGAALFAQALQVSGSGRAAFSAMVPTVVR